MGARRLRHDFLARAAARLKSGSIALAHHADDQVELFFLRIFRGSGGEGLSGMKWRNASPGDPKRALVRPLLDVSKSELEAFARDNKTAFRQDASNLRLDIRRNRIRRELLPLLRRDYQPALDRVVLRLMDIAGAEAEFVAQAARAWLKNRAAAAPVFSKASRRARPAAVYPAPIAEAGNSGAVRPCGTLALFARESGRDDSGTGRSPDAPWRIATPEGQNCSASRIQTVLGERMGQGKT
jgi:tRNA(Ile)-lysidine synthase TilS/MesJ